MARKGQGNPGQLHGRFLSGPQLDPTQVNLTTDKIAMPKTSKGHNGSIPPGQVKNILTPSVKTASVAENGAATDTLNGSDTPGGPLPDSIANPIVGSDLTAVWNLQFGGTGPRSGPTNGTWGGGAPDAYLISKGFTLVGGMLIMAIGAGTVNVANYDFAGADVRVFGSGTANFTDCASAGYGKGIVASCDASGSIISTGNTQIVNLNYCGFDGSNTWLGSGYLNHSHCRFENQKQFISSSSFAATGAPHITFDWCYITGGGVDPATNSHVELSQSNPGEVSGGSFLVTNTFVNLIDGQATAAPWGSAWTGIWSVGHIAIVSIVNSIHIGVTEVNANPANPDVINCTLAYLVDTLFITLANSVWQSGRFGYSLNQNGGNRPNSISGNRTFANVALTSADFD